jgi:hypothetical protein
MRLLYADPKMPLQIFPRKSMSSPVLPAPAAGQRRAHGVDGLGAPVMVMRAGLMEVYRVGNAA